MRNCMLCVADKRQQVDHSLKDCTIYPNPHDKIKKLDSLKYCSICLFKNHVRQQCKFKFHSTCRNCNKNHLTYLCPSVGNRVKSSEKTVSKTSVVHCGISNKCDTVILPTFTIDIFHKNDIYACRALHNTGSQRNFIHKEVAERRRLPVVNANLEIRIQGIHSDKLINTSVVQVPLRIDGVVYKVDAIVLPSIEIELSVEKLKTVGKAFTARGYALVDQALSDTNHSSHVTTFEFIMGPDAVKLLRPQTIAFGSEPHMAVYMQSRLGVLLLGEIEHLLSTIKHLPPSSDIDYKNCDKSLPMDSCVRLTVGSSIVSEVLDKTGEVITSQLKRATDEALDQCAGQLMNYDNTVDVKCSEVNEKLVNYVLTNAERKEDGRLVMPLPWNPECSHLLGRNFIWLNKFCSLI